MELSFLIQTMNYFTFILRQYMICYSHHLKHNRVQEVLMNKNVVDSIIASILFAVVSTVLGLILQAFGFSTQKAVIAGIFALFALMVLFLIARKSYAKYYALYIRKLTERLVENALNVNINETDEAKIAFKRKIVTRLQLGYSGIE